MRKYYVFIALLIVFSIGLAAVIILLTGTPAKQRAMDLDTTRLDDFSSLAVAANGYYISNAKLPASLDELKKEQDYLHTTDPETNASYTYKATSADTFELCTTFSLDSKDMPKNDPHYVVPDDSISSPYSPYVSNREHKKGYDCIKYEAADNGGLFKPAPMPEVKSSSEVLTN